MLSVNPGLSVTISVCVWSGILPHYYQAIVLMVGGKVQENRWLMVASGAKVQEVHDSGLSAEFSMYVAQQHFAASFVDTHTHARWQSGKIGD